MSDYKNLPYRLGVGLMIINDQNKIFVGKRIDSKNSFGWQMPQGGIEPGESPSKAALREMEEEIGCAQGFILAETVSWYCYDLPALVIDKMWNGQYRGQKQKWFLVKYTGKDEQINLLTQNPEFIKWRWVQPESLAKAAVYFKKNLYRSVLKEFQNLVL